MDTNRKFEVLTIGRSSIDLYSNDIGANFEDIKSFAAYVGGSSTNIAIGARRLGLRTALLTAVGDDKVGTFILTYLNREGVETKFIREVEGTRSSAVLLGIVPPDRFPLVYYRENAADWHISKDDIKAIGMDNVSCIVLSGTALARQPSRDATIFAAEEGFRCGSRVLLDLDFRADQWQNPKVYSEMIQKVLPRVDIVLGTEEELLASFYSEETFMEIKDQQISAPSIRGNLSQAIEQFLEYHLTIVLKRGERGARESERVEIKKSER